jgi:predicted MFS family arabinose efflux permease
MSSAAPALIVTLAIQALVSMAVITLPVLAPAVAVDLGVSPAAIGVYVALVYSAAMASSLAAGTMVARFGAVRVSQGSLMFCAAGLVISTVPEVFTMAVGALLIGLGHGPVTPASSHVLARTTAPERMSFVFSLKQTGVPLGGALAGAVVPSLMVFGWQRAVWVVAFANVACALLAQPLRRSLDTDREVERKLAIAGVLQPLKLVLAEPSLRHLVGCAFVFSIAQLSLVTYLVTYLHESLGYGLVQAGLVLAIGQGAGMAGRICWGYVADRWLGARRMLTALAAFMATSAVATALLNATTPLPIVLLSVIIFGATAIGWNGVFLAEVARVAAPGQAGPATGGTLAVAFLGVVVGPPLFAALAQAFGSYRPVFALLGLGLLLCIPVLRRGGPQRKQSNQTLEPNADARRPR